MTAPADWHLDSFASDITAEEFYDLNSVMSDEGPDLDYDDLDLLGRLDEAGE